MFEKRVLSENGKVKNINCRAMDKDYIINFTLVYVVCEEGCEGVVGVVTGTSAQKATCTCSYLQVIKITENAHSC